MLKHTLRLATEEDKQRILLWRNHPDVRKVMLTSHKITQQEHDIWWQKTVISTDRIILIFEQNGNPMGVVNFYQWDKENATAWWGFYLDNACLEQAEKTSTWIKLEQAVTHYSDKILKLHKLYCESLCFNQLAWTLHKKMGFQQCPAPQQATDTDKDVIYMVYTNQQHQPDLRPSLFILASHNTDFLAQSLIEQTRTYVQFPFKIGLVPFAQYSILLRASKQEIKNDDLAELHNPNSCLMFIERIEDFFDDISTPLTLETLESIDDKVQQYLQLVSSMSNHNANIFIADFQIQKTFPHSIENRKVGSELNQHINRWNQTIYSLQTHSNIHLLPYSDLLHRIGTSFSDKYWYLARAPFKHRAIESYGRMIIGCALAAFSRTARVLVLDLDNTLWQGVIGDDGIEGISLGGDYPGNIYQDLQSLFLALHKCGILLCICSKNNEEVALNCIQKHTQMRLRKQHFASWRINWLAKSINIASLADELNIGLEYFCFIDDNPVERAEVKSYHPKIFVPDLPSDPSQWYQFICELPEMWQQNISDADKARNELYLQRKVIKQEQSQFTNRVNFLSSLGMKLKIEPLTQQNQERTAQLFAKTNQFNTTTQRYTLGQLKEYAASPDAMVLHVKIKDKYLDQYEGIACMVITQISTKQWVIDNFVMSCRVMGRDIEQVLITEVIQQATLHNADSVIGRYVPSSKNTPVKTLYADNGFHELEAHWLYKLSSCYHNNDTANIKVEWNNSSEGEQD
jgi:UDP-4-amino-4,6-dideoxy-N-acetyl-beta-L-altrosamine N-acetyltransferase